MRDGEEERRGRGRKGGRVRTRTARNTHELLLASNDVLVWRRIPRLRTRSDRSLRLPVSPSPNPFTSPHPLPLTLTPPPPLLPHLLHLTCNPHYPQPYPSPFTFTLTHHPLPPPLTLTTYLPYPSPLTPFTSCTLLPPPSLTTYPRPPPPLLCTNPTISPSRESKLLLLHGLEGNVFCIIIINWYRLPNLY